MLCNFQKTKLCKHLLVGGALFAIGFGMNSCKDTYDLDSEQPSGLNSIYGYMADRGNFQNYMRLIRDLGQEEILSKTGSKTLFLANDAAFEEFYRENDWGVSSYKELSMAQKKILLGAAMIDNPYTTSMLSTAEGPVRGQVCRRVTSQTLYDTISVVSYEELPVDNPGDAYKTYWDDLRARGKDVVLFKDASAAPPVVHFTPIFRQHHKLQNYDMEFLYRLPEGSLSSDDVYIGKAKITNPNIFCLNGFIHEVDRVMVPLDNMAEILRKSDKATIFSELIERFSAPDHSTDLDNRYKALTNGEFSDSVFIKRYFSKRSVGGNSFEKDAFENEAEATLKFDPGWNAYIPSAFSERNAMMEDMAVILAPTDEAMEAWWNGTGSGALLRNRYQGSHRMENVPTSIVAELLNNNFLEQITMSLPSKFNESVYDDANEIMGLDTTLISGVAIGCNGVVYYTDKVYEPATFRSVLFPAVVNNETMNVIMHIIDMLDYKAYLNSMVSEYTLFIPTNEGLLTYIDPVSHGKADRELWQFYYDDKADMSCKKIAAKVYRLSELTYDEATKTYITEGVTPKKTYENFSIKDSAPLTSGKDDLKTPESYYLIDRLEEILDNMIVIGKITPDQEYYMTKGRSFVRVKSSGYEIDDQSTPPKQIPVVTAVSGTWQDENKAPLSVKSSTVHDNGYSYILDGGTLSGGSKSVADVLSEIPQCSEFYNMLVECAVDKKPQITNSMTWASASQTNGNLISVLEKGAIGNEYGEGKKVAYLLNGYHYTVYAPTNDAMQKAYEMGLPTMAELEEAEAYDEAYPETDGSKDKLLYADSLRAIMLDFVKYHIQDNAIYIDNGFSGGQYESAKIELVGNLDDDGNFIKEEFEGEQIITWVPRKPFKLNVEVSKEGLKVTDKTGNEYSVLKEEGLYNLQAREYWLDNNNATVKDVEEAMTINTVSSAVVHVIDGALIYDNSAPITYDADGKPVTVDGTPEGAPIPVYKKFGEKTQIQYNQFHYISRKLATSK